MSSVLRGILPEHAYGAYCYALALFLGDGCLDEKRPGYWRIRLYQDSCYPSLLTDAVGAFEIVFPQLRLRVGPERPGVRCTVITAQGRDSSVPVLLPQGIGGGPKHSRNMALTVDQRLLIHASWLNCALFIRGLIHSDGCRFTSVTRKKVASGKMREYAYVGYSFKNASSCLLAEFEDALGRLGVESTRSNSRTVMVRQRKSVERLDRLIGPKR